MKIIDTSKTDPLTLTGWEREQVYNGLDCCITAEVLDVLLEQLDPLTQRTYDFSRSLQGPVLEMNLRGVKIDVLRKAEVIEHYHELVDRLERQLDDLALDGLSMPGFNWRSNPDLHTLFYDILGIPPMKSKGKVSVDRKALEKIGEYTKAKIFVNHLTKMRDLGMKIKAMKQLGARAMTAYNIAGTVTGRFSSSFTAFGEGGNLQNIEEEIRQFFIADDGMKMAYLDGEQGESRVVGAIEWNLFRDGTYLDACEGGDLHTAVAKLVWPELPWSGDLQRDKQTAEKPYYRHHSYRFMCKRIGHGSNYGGEPPTIALEANLPVGVIRDFQPKYFTAFPSHLEWHDYVRGTLRKAGHLVSLAGRRRWFFGRRNDDKVVREAIAYDPQSSLVDIVNHGMLNVWRARSCELLMQGHDAIIVQYPEEQEDEIIPRVLEQLRYPLKLRDGREFVIPYGCETGWNWGKWNAETNPDGLKKWKGGDKRKRQPTLNILDRPIRRRD